MSELNEAIERVINSIKPTDDPMVTLEAIRNLRTVYEMDRANNPPEHLPSEESKWMATNDYGYSATTEDVEPAFAKTDRAEDNPSAVMNKLAKTTDNGYGEFTAAANALNEVTSSYENISQALQAAKERYQRAFFRMNENIGEVNTWLQGRLRDESEENQEV